MKIAHTIIHYRLFWKAVLGFNGDWIHELWFFVWLNAWRFFFSFFFCIAMRRCLFCSPLENTSKTFFYLLADWFVHLYFIVYFAFVFHCLLCICISLFTLHLTSICLFFPFGWNLSCHDDLQIASVQHLM
jgi:hypothetical protein